MTGRSILLFVAAALAEIGGAYLVWIGLNEDRGALFVALGVLALGNDQRGVFHPSSHERAWLKPHSRGPIWGPN